MRRAARVPPWTCALRVLRTWAAPSPLKRAADPPLCSGYRGSCLESKQRVIRSAKSPPATWQGAISTSRLLLLTTPGTTYAPAQPLAAKRRGGCAGGRWAAGEGVPAGANPPPAVLPPILPLQRPVDSEAAHSALRFLPWPRSEERRIGKECRSRWSSYH